MGVLHVLLLSVVTQECQHTHLGCCWDGVTPRLDNQTMSSQSSGCPPCRDRYQNVCRTFRADCQSRYAAGDFMRRFCAQTCKRCGEGCRDQLPYKCENFAEKYAWCQTKPDIMRLYCAKTCRFCKPDHDESL